MSNITDEDVSILMNQSSITKNQARELLIINEGDLINSLFMLQTNEIDINNLKELKKKKNEVIEQETDDFIVNTSNQDNLKKYREIVDDKDSIYDIKQKQKEDKKKNSKEKPNFSIEELYSIKRANSTFNSIKVL
tara:strand:+ start:491 stop:895 length:405 start_codon:yes stop_codon:yes gene_type:complete